VRIEVYAIGILTYYLLLLLIHHLVLSHTEGVEISQKGTKRNSNQGQERQQPVLLRKDRVKATYGMNSHPIDHEVPISHQQYTIMSCFYLGF
jgi:hypothetical protein